MRRQEQLLDCPGAPVPRPEASNAGLYGPAWKRVARTRESVSSRHLEGAQWMPSVWWTRVCPVFCLCGWHAWQTGHLAFGICTRIFLVGPVPQHSGDGAPCLTAQWGCPVHFPPRLGHKDMLCSDSGLSPPSVSGRIRADSGDSGLKE